LGILDFGATDRVGPRGRRLLRVADIHPLIDQAVARGDHVRVGLEDAPLGPPISPLALVEEAVRIVRGYGSEFTSAAEVRQALGSIAAGSRG
jgi:uncharacterized protein (DUF849 family)